MRLTRVLRPEEATFREVPRARTRRLRAAHRAVLDLHRRGPNDFAGSKPPYDQLLLVLDVDLKFR
jgi:hypothetical protein